MSKDTAEQVPVDEMTSQGAALVREADQDQRQARQLLAGAVTLRKTRKALVAAWHRLHDAMRARVARHG